uniref:Transposase n=1 Tax=Strongyloides venezuelensis TaxID=75913 RepID=A0A0K0G585_STRVS
MRKPEILKLMKDNKYTVCNIKFAASNIRRLTLTIFGVQQNLSAPILHSLYQKLRTIKSTSIKSENVFPTLSYIRNC